MLLPQAPRERIELDTISEEPVVTWRFAPIVDADIEAALPVAKVKTFVQFEADIDELIILNEAFPFP